MSLSRRRRAGMSSLEVVLTTGLVFPFAVIMVWLGVNLLQIFHQMIGSLVGWPHL